MIANETLNKKDEDNNTNRTKIDHEIDGKNNDEQTTKQSMSQFVPNDSSFVKINTLSAFLLSYHKQLFVALVCIHVLIFHLDKIFFNAILIVLFCFGFLYYNLSNQSLNEQLDAYLKSNRQKCPSSAGLIKFDWYIESSSILSSNVNNSPNQIDTNSINSLSRSRIQFDQRSLVNIKPSLTGSYAIDEELHSIIELVIRDYIDSWYKTHISSREEFDQALRVLIYNSIRNLNKCLKSIEWEQFIINIVAHSLIIHMRILKKAKEKMRLASSKTTTASEPLTTSNFQKMFINTINMSRANEKNLIEMFFDLEAEIEKSICRDGIAYNSKEIEDEFLQEMSEFLCYSCLPIDTFNCIAFKSVIREILAHHLIKTSINNITDPDYINQTVLYLSQNQEHSVDNFMITLNYCESLEELNELRIKLEENISRTRSNDKGGQNDQEIKLRLSSLAFVKRRIDIRMATVIKTMNRISSYSNRTISDQQQSSTSSGSFSPSEEEYKKFLFHANLNNLDFDTAIRNESIQLCFIEFMGKQNVQNLMSFYLNAEMFRQFARKELAKCSAESTTTPKPDIKDTKLAIKDFAKGLINSYLLSAVNFTAMSQDEDEQPINLSNRIYYKKELVRTLENLENEDCINDSLLDELQEKIYLLMKQKYYPEFKNYPEFHKVLFKTDLIKQQSIQSAVESKAISSVSLSSISSSLSQSSTSSSSQSILSPTSPTNNNASTRLINDALTSIDEDFGIDSGYMNESVLALDTSSISDQKTLNDDSDVLSLSADRVSQSSFEMWPPPTSSSQKSDIRLSAIITSAGRCNDIKSSYAIYIIDVTKQSETTNKIEFWQTYRRFNDFNDLHTLLKKRFPQINIVLPAKSFKSSLNDELIEKRIIELNRYLQMLTSQDMLTRYPGLLELMLKFLENKRWESQNTLKKKFGLLLTPMISSVQNIQTTLINAPDNVIGMVKGVSEMVLNEATRSTSSASNTPLRNNDSLPRNNSQSSGSRLSNASNQSFFSNSMTPQNNSQQSPLISVIATPSSASNLRSPQNSAAAITDDNKELIDRTVLNDDDMQSNNLLIRVILLLIDEIFDLKEKNQWLRQPLMAIVRGYLKNIKGDSMNRKIKEQIANYLSEKEMARYLKNFRKRMWPKGYLADVMPERNRSVKEITKILAKTTLLSYVTDELRHILGNETTRRGVFDLFELFQHQTLNKRILNILIESLLTSLFSQPPTPTGGQSNTTSSLTSSLIMGSSSSTMVAASTPPPITSWSSGSTRQTSFVLQALHLHLSQSNRVKPEWKLTSLTKQHHLLHSVSSISPSTSNHLNANLIDNDEQVNSPPPPYSDQLTKRKTSMSRSKSLYNDIQC